MHPDKTHFDISLHQVRQICYPGLESHNSPEGIHRDGADYIVSALVLNRFNVQDGESIIYTPDKKHILFQDILKENFSKLAIHLTEICTNPVLYY